MPERNGSVMTQPSVSRRLVNILGPFFGLLLVIGLFSLSSEVRPYFLTGANFKIILTQTVIVAIGMMGIARGTAKWLSGSQTLSSPPTPLIDNLMELREPTRLFPFPRGVWMVVGLAIMMVLVMRQTVFGRYIFAIGANEAAARLSGI